MNFEPTSKIIFWVFQIIQPIIGKIQNRDLRDEHSGQPVENMEWPHLFGASISDQTWNDPPFIKS